MGDLISPDREFLQDLERIIGQKIPDQTLANEFDLGFVSREGTIISLKISNVSLPEIPRSIGKCKDLGSLHLDGNGLSRLPDEIGGLDFLGTLIIKNNLLKVLPKRLESLTGLKEIDLSGNSFTEFPTVLCKLKYLLRITLSKNNVKKIPENIKEISSLHLLDLSGNGISEIPEYFKDFNIGTLDLHDNYLSHLPAQLPKMQDLFYIDLRNNPIKNLTPQEKAMLKNLQKKGVCIRGFPPSIIEPRKGILEGLPTKLAKKRLITSVAELSRVLDLLQNETPKSYALLLPPNIGVQLGVGGSFIFIEIIRGPNENNYNIPIVPHVKDDFQVQFLPDLLEPVTWPELIPFDVGKEILAYLFSTNQLSDHVEWKTD